jgi:hypothetical protein
MLPFLPSQTVQLPSHLKIHAHLFIRLAPIQRQQVLTPHKIKLTPNFNVPIVHQTIQPANPRTKKIKGVTRIKTCRETNTTTRK